MSAKKLTAEAAAAGISPLLEVRAELIAMRDHALKTNDFHTAVFYSHLIWWLTVTTEYMED